MAVLVPNLLHLSNSIIVTDPKGELAAITSKYRRTLGPVIILNPFGVLTDIRPDLASDGYNPLRHLNPHSKSYPDDCARIAEALVKVTPGKSEHFSMSARQLITAAIMRAGFTHEGCATIQHVRNLLSLPRKEFIELIGDMMTHEVDGELYMPLVNKASRFLSPTDEVSDVLSTVSVQLESFDSIHISSDLAAGDFDFRRLKTETITVYIILPPEELEQHSPWLRMIINNALYALMTPPVPGRESVIVILEEMYATVGRLPVIEKVIGLVRGYGIQLWPIFQSLLQAQDLYGRNWESFIGTAGVLQSFAPGDTFTADYISKLAGKSTIGVPSVSGSNLSFSLTGVPLWLPQDLMKMGRGQTVLIGKSLPAPACAQVLHYSEVDWVSEFADANPYDRGLF